MKEIKTFDTNKLTQLNLNLLYDVENHLKQISDKSVELNSLKKKIVTNYRDIKKPQFTDTKTVFKNIVTMRLVQNGITRFEEGGYVCDVNTAKLITYNSSMHIDSDSLLATFINTSMNPKLKSIAEELKELTLIYEDQNRDNKDFSGQIVSPSKITTPYLFNMVVFNISIPGQVREKIFTHFRLSSALKTINDTTDCSVWYSDNKDVCHTQSIHSEDYDGLEYLKIEDKHHIRGDKVIDMQLVEQHYQHIKSELLLKMETYINNLDKTIRVLKEYCIINNI